MRTESEIRLELERLLRDIIREKPDHLAVSVMAPRVTDISPRNAAYLALEWVLMKSDMPPVVQQRPAVPS